MAKMTKADAIELLGDGNLTRAATKLDLTHGALSQWPDVLDTTRADRVRGAAVRLGRFIPPHLRQEDEDTAAL